MSNDLENTDLYKTPLYSEKLYDIFHDEDISAKEQIQKIKKEIVSGNVTAEDITHALDYMKYMAENKDVSKDIIEVISAAIKSPSSGFASGHNENLNPYEYSQYYEVDSNVEARNLATTVLQYNPEVEKEIFDIYEKLAEHIPVYDDLATVSKDHPKAVDLFEKIYNKDSDEHSLFSAAQAMNILVSAENLDTVQRMVDTLKSKKDSGKFPYLNSMERTYDNAGSVKSRISQIKAEIKKNEQMSEQKTKSDERSERRQLHLDPLEEKMHFIETKVKRLRKQNFYNVSTKKQQMADKVRISAYKEYMTQGK